MEELRVQFSFVLQKFAGHSNHYGIVLRLVSMLRHDLVCMFSFGVHLEFYSGPWDQASQY